MGAENDHSPTGNFLEIFHKNCALARQFVHDITVVDNLSAHVDGWPQFLQNHADDVDSTDDTCTKSPWPQQQ